MGAFSGSQTSRERRARRPPNEKSGSWAAAVLPYVYPRYITGYHNNSVKENMSVCDWPIADGKGFINPYDRRELFSSQTPQPRRASAPRKVLCAAYLNAANRAPQHRHRRWDKGWMTTAPASGRSSSFRQRRKKHAQICSLWDNFRNRTCHQSFPQHETNCPESHINFTRSLLFLLSVTTVFPQDQKQAL